MAKIIYRSMFSVSTPEKDVYGKDLFGFVSGLFLDEVRKFGPASIEITEESDPYGKPEQVLYLYADFDREFSCMGFENRFREQLEDNNIAFNFFGEEA